MCPHRLKYDFRFFNSLVGVHGSCPPPALPHPSWSAPASKLVSGASSPRGAGFNFPCSVPNRGFIALIALDAIDRVALHVIDRIPSFVVRADIDDDVDVAFEANAIGARSLADRTSDVVVTFSPFATTNERTNDERAGMSFVIRCRARAKIDRIARAPRTPFAPTSSRARAVTTTDDRRLMTDDR